jgi:hypothetical protein
MSRNQIAAHILRSGHHSTPVGRSALRSPHNRAALHAPTASSAAGVRGRRWPAAMTWATADQGQRPGRPAVLSAPGLVIATSNKADLWALTSGLRGQGGPVWTFDPQAIAHAPRSGGGPLRAIRDAPEPAATKPHSGSPPTSSAPSAARGASSSAPRAYSRMRAVAAHADQHAAEDRTEADVVARWSVWLRAEDRFEQHLGAVGEGQQHTRATGGWPGRVFRHRVWRRCCAPRRRGNESNGRDPCRAGRLRPIGGPPGPGVRQSAERQRHERWECAPRAVARSRPRRPGLGGA